MPLDAAPSRHHRSRRGGALLLGLCAAGLLTACTSESDAPPPQAAPPPPPAACLLDGATLTATTGLTWVPDQTTASDSRCVYDPAGATPGTAGFIAVDVTTATAEPDEQLDTIAQLCERGSRTTVDGAGGGLVCRFDDTNIYAALVRGGQVVTISTSAVPEGTTTARLGLALTEQLRRLGQA